MVDREARDKALHALKRFIACETTNDEYEGEYPLPELFGRKESKDLAIKAVHTMSWNWFDDFHPHKLEGGYSLEPEVQQVADRCALFLGASYEYEWKEANFISTGFIQSAMTILGLSRSVPTVGERITSHLDQPEGDASVWPFFRIFDYVRASLKERP